MSKRRFMSIQYNNMQIGISILFRLFLNYRADFCFKIEDEGEKIEKRHVIQDSLGSAVGSAVFLAMGLFKLSCESLLGGC